jgi:peptidoglycan-N-acetylmuramic acid deacetylase
MKIYKSILVAVMSTVLIFSFAFSSSAECKSWYIKRNGTEPPTPPPDIEMIRENDGYFINDALGENEKKLYLTFDAGYENGNLEKILDVLKSENVPAAFFILDNLIVKNTDLVIRMGDEGHLVCNHTKRHRNLSSAKDDEIIADLTALEVLYKEKTGREMDKYFRFPEGKYSESALKCIKNMGYKTMFWSFGYEDWDNNRQPSCDYAIKKILSNTHNGAIILLHPNSSTNAKILPELISSWRKMGYEFGTLHDFDNI